MHRVILTSVCVVSLVCGFASLKAFAATTLNPADLPGMGNIRISGYLDLGHERDMEDSGFTWEVDTERYLARGEYGIMDRLSVFVDLGVAAIEDSDLGFAAGAGAKYLATTILNGDIDIGVSGQILWFKTEEDETIVDVNYKAEATWLEFQLASVANYTGFDRFDFFGGFSLSFVNGDSEVKGGGSAISSGFDSDDIFGLILGSAYSFSENFKVCGEIHLINETCFTVGLSYQIP